MSMTLKHLLFFVVFIYLFILFVLFLHWSIHNIKHKYIYIEIYSNSNIFKKYYLFIYF